MLLKAANARWMVVPSETQSLYHSEGVNATSLGQKEEDAEQSTHLGAGTHIHGLRIAFPEEAVEICPTNGCTIGRAAESHICVDSPMVRS